MSGGPAVTVVRHNRIDLALHRLADGPGRPLLLLHGLGERTPGRTPAHLRWTGPVLGLDFTGHGASTVPVGGGYTSEILVGDVDAALEHLGEPVTVLGRGLGAYIGLLSAAARPDLVHGVVLADGPGIAGGGVHPGSPSVISPAATGGPPDPFALLELARDVRPPDYARTIAGFAVEGSELEVPLWVATVVRPAWLEALVGQPGVRTGSVGGGLAYYGGVRPPEAPGAR
jgi:pimeloyl-ACP methyl ester carboxylesterase